MPQNVRFHYLFKALTEENLMAYKDFLPQVTAYLKSYHILCCVYLVAARAYKLHRGEEGLQHCKQVKFKCGIKIETQHQQMWHVCLYTYACNYLHVI